MHCWVCVGYALLRTRHTWPNQLTRHCPAILPHTHGSAATRGLAHDFISGGGHPQAKIALLVCDDDATLRRIAKLGSLRPQCCELMPVIAEWDPLARSPHGQMPEQQQHHGRSRNMGCTAGTEVGREWQGFQGTVWL